MSPIRFRLILLATLACAVGCASAGGPGGANRVIARSSFPNVVPRIATLRAEPAEIPLVVGQIFMFDSLRIRAYDASGRSLGLLPVYNRHMEPGAAQLDPRGGVRATQPGESMLLVTPPLWEGYGAGRVAPSAQVRIRVSGP